MLQGRMAEGDAEQQRINAILTTGATVAAVAGSVVAGGTGATGGAWDTAGHRDTTITTITEIKTQLNALIAELQNRKILP